MTQNIYADDAFFAAYSALPRSAEGLERADEWPALRALLPEMRGLRVLDLGCGFGWFSRWAVEAGAASVLGIDLSEKMLARARAETGSHAINYVRRDLEEVELPRVSFDLVYSSLAFHYVSNLEGLMSRVHDALVPGGRLVFSVEHPMFTAPIRGEWSTDLSGRKAWPINSYLEEGPRTRDWLAEGVIKQHRTFATYANLLIDLGFAVSAVIEWGPTDEQIAGRPALADERDRPTFLLVGAGRPKAGP